MERTWGFGIVRGSEWDVGRTSVDALCALASDAAGVRFVPYGATSYRELTSAITAGDVGLAWLPPVSTITLESQQVASPLAIPARDGQTSYHAAFIVRRGGPKTIADLKGRRAAWVDRDSASGYLVPRLSLAAQGVDVLRYFARELFVHSHGRVIEAVVSGEADVGATFCNVDPSSGAVLRSAWLDEAGMTIRPVETLATMGPIPNDALVGSNELPVGARAGLTRWLLALDARGKEVFRRFIGTSELRVPSPDHYEAMRHVLRAARARGQDALPPESRMRMRVSR